MPKPAARLILLIMLLQRQPNQKATELAEQLGVSARTVHRYMEMLDEMGIPVYSERGPNGGFSLVRGYKMPPLVLTPEEATAVYLGTGLVEEMWGQLYREAARGALAKLDNVLPEEQRHEIAWARRALLATHMHRIDYERLAPLLEKLRRAAREHRRLRLLYRSRSQAEALTREVDLYALVHRWGWWYAVGYCHLRQAVRSFRVDRMAELTLLDQTFDLPTDFDIQTYLAAEMSTRPLLSIRMRFMPDAALLAHDESSSWESMEEQPDGAVEVTFVSPNLEWAARTVLAYGPQVVVLAPEVLRVLVAAQAQGIVELYQS
ncbi:MAG: YafY family transcriptional regulator [Anaerolineae bacterium]|nr:YafY family transcriptional regulator [Anaerolineae bacterium]